jgi:hypothetical protein
MKRLAIAAALALALTGAAQAEPTAGQVLFETPFLSTVQPGTTLSYAVTREAADAALGPASDGRIEMTLAAGAQQGTRRATVVLWRAEGRRALESFAEMAGNPVVMVFLEQDVAEMGQLLRGSPFYLRNRIKAALQAAAVEAVRLDFEGRSIEGRRIAVTPFAADPNRDKLGRFADKQYEILLAEAVPGGIFAMRAVTPQGAGAEPLLHRRLTFVGATAP